MPPERRPIPVFKGPMPKRITPPPPPPKPEGDGMWTRAETAEFLRFSLRKLSDETKLNRIRHIRCGRLVRYDPADVRAYLEARKQGGLVPVKEDGL